MVKGKAQQPASGAEVLQCDGQTLKAMIGAGMTWLEKNYEAVNAMNVFPVPDGDTGTNMLLTMRNAYKEIADSAETHAGKIADKTYNGALMGARGNSGVILSQLLLGFSRGLEGSKSFAADQLVRSFRLASQTADKVRGMKPVEGTILTVARDGATAAEQALRQTKDIHKIMEQIVAEMFRSVDRTPDLLVKDGEYILKSAGVVDSGGMGLAYIMDGMLRNLSGEVIESTNPASVETVVAQQSTINLSGLDFPYDVQFLLLGNELDIDTITRTIEGMGDSALVAGDTRLVKVHVHVTNPGVPLNYASGLGKLTDVVVENMALQYEDFKSHNAKTDGPVRERVEPPPVVNGSIVVVTVAAGEGFTRILYSLGASRVISGGQTMNPSTEDFVRAITDLPTDKVVVLPNNKNIILAAQQAVELIDDKIVRIVPTTTLPQGIAALLALDSSGEIDAVTESMRAASANVETGEITRATRDVTVNGIKVRQGQIIGLHNDDLRVAGDDLTAVTVELIRAMAPKDLELITIYVGADVTAQNSETLVSKLTEIYPSHVIELQQGSQPHYFYIISAE
jgi:fatty acid kinase